MIFQDLLLIFTGGVNLGVGLMILFRDYRNNANRLYFIFAFFMSLWAICLLIFRIGESEVSDFFGRSSYIAGLAMSSSFYLFTHVFPYQNKPINKVKVWCLTTLIAILAYISLGTSWLVQRTAAINGVVSAITNSYSHWFYGALLTALVILGLVNLARKMKDGDGSHSRRVARIFYVSLIAAFFGIIFDVLLPLFGDYSLNWLGPQFLILLSSAVGVIILESKVTVHG